MISMTCLMGEPGTAGPAVFAAAPEDAAADVIAAVAATRNASPAARNRLSLTRVIVGQQGVG